VGTGFLDVYLKCGYAIEFAWKTTFNKAPSEGYAHRAGHTGHLLGAPAETKIVASRRQHSFVQMCVKSPCIHDT